MFCGLCTTSEKEADIIVVEETQAPEVAPVQEEPVAAPAASAVNTKVSAAATFSPEDQAIVDTFSINGQTGYPIVSHKESGAFEGTFTTDRALTSATIKVGEVQETITLDSKTIAVRGDKETSPVVTLPKPEFTVILKTKDSRHHIEFENQQIANALIESVAVARAHIDKETQKKQLQVLISTFSRECSEKGMPVAVAAPEATPAILKLDSSLSTLTVESPAFPGGSFSAVLGSGVSVLRGDSAKEKGVEVPTQYNPRLVTILRVKVAGDEEAYENVIFPSEKKQERDDLYMCFKILIIAAKNNKIAQQQQ